MTRNIRKIVAALSLLPLIVAVTPAQAHKLRKQGNAVTVAESGITVTPSRDWNQLSANIGKNTETWTVDGEQLNDITFYGGIASGKPLVKERHKKRDPLPKFSSDTLLIEVPELLERTYRTYKNSGSFAMSSIEPARFLDHDGVFFNYEYTDEDQLTRKGEARAAIISGKLYMITFDAPRLSYYGKLVGDFRALADTAKIR